MMSGIPVFTATIDFHCSDEELAKRVQAGAIAMLPSYKGLAPESLKVSKISGGITNILVKIEPLEGGALPVTMRLFGDNTEVLIDREREIKVLVQLNEGGFGAKVLALFTNGRIEAFLNGKALKDEELAVPAMVERIAPLLRRFHGAAVQEDASPQLFPVLRKWLKMARGLSFPEDAAKQAAYDAVDMGALGAEVDELEARLAGMGAPTVYSHNDVLSGNLMWDPEGRVMHIIDFEYGMFNFRGFDLGNHFNEYAGFEGDYSRYPSREAQMHFYRHYLAAGSGGKPEDVPGAELEALYVETNCFSLASHVFWALWCLLQAKHSPIDFDYIEYFGVRMGEYRRRKEDVLALLDAPRP